MSPRFRFRDRLRAPASGESAQSASPASDGRHGVAGVRRGLVGVLAVVSFFVGACSSAAPSSFDPSAPCTADSKVAGAYPDLEARVPAMIGTQAPATLDSGRNCTAPNLTTLASHAIREVRFAGGVWKDGSQSGVTLAVFQAPGLQSDWMGEWYEAGARAGRVTGNITVTKPVVAGQTAHRMDLVNGESKQTVITWQATGSDGLVKVLIAGDEPEARIQEALAAFQ